MPTVSLYSRMKRHSRRRILHVGDFTTGKAIMAGLIEALRECPNVTIESDATAVDLQLHSPITHEIRWQTTDRLPVMAPTYSTTGGTRSIATLLPPRCWQQAVWGGFIATPPIRRVRGDGLAMANRAGARIANAEYVQFHPTALAVPVPRRDFLSAKPCAAKAACY